MNLELIRVIFPRWNFFDRIGYQLLLEVKRIGNQDWLPITFKDSRTLLSLFINPEGTRLHAEMTTLENFVQDIQKFVDAKGEVDPIKVKSLTSYRMVRSLVLNRLMVNSEKEVQFRVLAKAGDETIVIYSSETKADAV